VARDGLPGPWRPRQRPPIDFVSRWAGAPRGLAAHRPLPSSVRAPHAGSIGCGARISFLCAPASACWGAFSLRLAFPARQTSSTSRVRQRERRQPIDRSGPRFRLYSRVSGLPPGRLWRSRNVVVGPQCRKFVRFEAAFGTWFSNGGGHMIKILLTVAVLGCVGGFAGLAMAQGKPGEALGRDISSQCAHRRTMPPDPRDACGRNQRSDTQVGSGQDGSSQAALVGPGPGGGQGNGIGPGNAGNQGNAIGPGNAGGQGNGIGPGNGGGQGKGRR